MSNNDVAISLDGTSSLTELAVGVDKGQIYIMILKHRHPIPEGTMTLTPEQLYEHIMGCIKAYEKVQGPVGQTKLILPHMIGVKPFMP